jgi:hypothetical protein
VKAAVVAAIAGDCRFPLSDFPASVEGGLGRLLRRLRPHRPISQLAIVSILVWCGESLFGSLYGLLWPTITLGSTLDDY